MCQIDMSEAAIAFIPSFCCALDISAALTGRWACHGTRKARPAGALPGRGGFVAGGARSSGEAVAPAPSTSPSDAKVIVGQIGAARSRHLSRSCWSSMRLLLGRCRKKNVSRKSSVARCEPSGCFLQHHSFKAQQTVADACRAFLEAVQMLRVVLILNAIHNAPSVFGRPHLRRLIISFLPGADIDLGSR